MRGYICSRWQHSLHVTSEGPPDHLTALWPVQSVILLSAGGQYFVVVQPDGSLVVYNALSYKNQGALPHCALYSAGTGGTGVAPFSLIMQTVGGPHYPGQCLASSALAPMAIACRGIRLTQPNKPYFTLFAHAAASMDGCATHCRSGLKARVIPKFAPSPAQGSV